MSPSSPQPSVLRRPRALAGRLRRRVGGRSQEIQRLEERVAYLEGYAREQVRLRYAMAPTPAGGAGRASWQAYVRMTRRQYQQVSRLPDRDLVPHWRLPRKLDSYRLAASHGVRTPTVYAVWDRTEDIDLADLPDTFVLKADGGSTSRGVFPVRRDGAGFTQVDGSRTWGPDDIPRRLRRLERTGKGRPPYFAEELLRDESGSALPHDVKLYCFYGEVGQVLIRDVPVHGQDDSLRKRYVRADGTDLTAEVPEAQDLSLPLPPHFEDLVRTGELLSRAVPFPFVRVDLYDTTQGVTFGELTLVPGGRNAWTLEHDTHLGTLVEAAQARLWRDLAAGRPFDFVRGDRMGEVVPAPGHAG